MLKDTLLQSDSLLNKLDMTTIVVYPSKNNNCCVSCHTNNDLVYTFIKSKSSDYNEKEFAIRNWSSLHNILNSFDDINLKIYYDSESYPTFFELKNNRIKMKYYLQNFTFTKNQSDMYEEYSKKKISLGVINDGIIIDSDVIKDIACLSSLTKEKWFRLKSDNNKLYIYFGDENQSIDNGSILISDDYYIDDIKDDVYFSIDYFINIYKSLYDEKYFKIKILSDKIIYTYEDENYIKVAILRGKHI